MSGADVKLPPLPGVTGNKRRVYLESQWGAPIIWSNTQANAAARLQNGPFNIGLTVRVLGRSYASFLQRLITSADKYFMNGQNVTYFMFTDTAIARPNKTTTTAFFIILEVTTRCQSESCVTVKNERSL